LQDQAAMVQLYALLAWNPAVYTNLTWTVVGGQSAPGDEWLLDIGNADLATVKGDFANW